MLYGKSKIFWLCFSFVLIGCNRFHLFFPADKQEIKIRAWAYYFQGLELENTAKWKIAAESFYSALALEPDNARISTHLAKNLFYSGKKELAMGFLKKALEHVEDQDYLLFFDIGFIYQKATYYKQAEQCYRQALIIFPRFSECQKCLENIQKKLTEP